MAINVTKEPVNIYPAYNDSYLEFTSTLSNQVFAEVKFNGNTFKVFSLNGVYVFNLKELVKSMYPNSFKDSFKSSLYGTNDTSVIKDLEVIIVVYNSSSQEQISKTYKFYRGVKQIGENLFLNNCQLLNYSKNGVDYYLHWFEGYPLDFILQNVNSGNTISIKNKNNNYQYDGLVSISDNSFRIQVDKGDKNWTNENIVPVFDAENNLEIFENNVFKTNLTLKKHQSRRGVYLKWFNSFGGYSYWLFNEYFNNETQSSNSNLIQTNYFQNIGEETFTENYKDIGKDSEKSIEIRTIADISNYNHIQDLFSSPYVGMWSEKEPFRLGEWITVNCRTRGFKYNNKRESQKISVTIDLPKQYNLSL